MIERPPQAKPRRSMRIEQVGAMPATITVTLGVPVELATDPTVPRMDARRAAQFALRTHLLRTFGAVPKRVRLESNHTFTADDAGRITSFTFRERIEE
jgi:hypothetical protein